MNRKVKHREVKLTIENDRLLYEVITEKKAAAIDTFMQIHDLIIKRSFPLISKVSWYSLW